MDGKVIIGCDLDTRSFDAQIDYVENQMLEIEDKLKQADMGFEVGDVQKLEADYEKLGIRLDSLRKKQTKLNQEQAQMGKLDLSGVQTGIDNVNKGLNKTLKKVAKWGLAIFGIRSAYLAVRSAMGTISQYDDKLASDVEYIKYALAYTLKPVIEWILNAVVKLLQYVNYIAKAWTGKNLFKTADAFKNAQKNAKGLNKELQKTTASFDEMNVLQDNKSGGGADISTPNIDLTGMQGEAPAWLQWIVDNKDTIIAVMGAIGFGIFTWKLGLEGIKALGIGVAVAGIILLLQDLKDLFDDPTWEKFGKVIRDIGLITIGVGLLIENVPLIVAGAIALIVGLVIQNWEKIKKAFKDGIQWIKDKFKSMVTFFSNLISKIVGLFKKIGTKVGNAISGAFKAVINGVLKAIENILNFPIKQVNKLIDVINKVPGINISALPTFSLPRLAKGGIINQPGRGIPVGNAIGGERGQEGVIPLTDSQQMQLLGEAIGRYVTINANITNTMNGRVISRELQKVNNANDFAFNR